MRCTPLVGLTPSSAMLPAWPLHADVSSMPSNNTSSPCPRKLTLCHDQRVSPFLPNGSWPNLCTNLLLFFRLEFPAHNSYCTTPHAQLPSFMPVPSHASCHFSIECKVDNPEKGGEHNLKEKVRHTG